MWISPEWVADKIHNPKRTGTGFIGRCPAHKDRHPSFRVSLGEKGTVMFCHAGCSIDAICEALQIRPSQLFYEQPVSSHDETFAALQRLIRQRTPVDLWTLETFGDVAVKALVDDSLTEFEWVTSEVDAIRHHGWVWFMPYEGALKYWKVVQDGVLFEFLRTWWERKGKPNWRVVSDAAGYTMEKTWKEQTIKHVN